jgi:hypothetical protein
MKRSVIKELIKRSMREVAPKTNSGVMTPEEEKDAAAMAAINKYEKEEKEMDLRSGPSVVPGAVPMKEGSNIPTDIKWEVVRLTAAALSAQKLVAVTGISKKAI